MKYHVCSNVFAFTFSFFVVQKYNSFVDPERTNWEHFNLSFLYFLFLVHLRQKELLLKHWNCQDPKIWQKNKLRTWQLKRSTPENNISMLHDSFLELDIVKLLIYIPTLHDILKFKRNALKSLILINSTRNV